MTVLLVIIGILFLVGIFVISGASVVKQRGREEFLEALADFADSKVMPIEGREKTFAINFRFEGINYVFEDVEEVGFSGKINKAYLKTKINKDYVLSFTEKQTQRATTTEIFKSSDVQDNEIIKNLKIEVPKVLQSFNVHTNNPALTDYLFADSKVVGVLAGFRNMDHRGYSSMAIKALNGELSLEFNTLDNYRPNLDVLRTSVSSIEEYLDQMVVLVRGINNYPQA